MVFAKLGGCVSLCFQYFSQCRIYFLNTQSRSRNANGYHAGTNWHLSHKKCCTPSSTTGLPVMIGKQYTITGYTINIRRLPHHSMGVGAYVPHPNIISPNDNNIGLFLRLCKYM